MSALDHFDSAIENTKNGGLFEIDFDIHKHKPSHSQTQKYKEIAQQLKADREQSLFDNLPKNIGAVTQEKKTLDTKPAVSVHIFHINLYLRHIYFIHLHFIFISSSS